MRSAELARGKRFYFQRDINNRWAWSLLPIEPTSPQLVPPAACQWFEYGHTFDSVEDMTSALDKWSEGCFEVTWLAFDREFVATMSPEFVIYRDGERYQAHQHGEDFLAIAEKLADTHTAHTWSVRTLGGYLVAVFRRPVTQSNDDVHQDAPASTTPYKETQMAYVVTANDIENVLQQYSLRVSDTQGKSFETMAAELVDALDMTTVVEAASNADTEGTKGQAVFNALHTLLVKEGIIEF